MHHSLIVVPGLCPGPWKYGLDREQEPHLVRFEDAALWINQRYALTLESEVRFQLVRGQMIVDLTEPSHMIECRHAEEPVKFHFRKAWRHFRVP
jgi:hypothetical protein